MNLTAQYSAAGPGMAVVKFPFSKPLNVVLGKYPGCLWSAPHHGWKVPNELVQPIAKFARDRMGWSVTIAPQGPEPTLAIAEAAYPFQKEDIRKAIKAKRAMLAWEMGCGKTLGAIEWLKNTKAGRILVVCPAMARGVWERELQKWWPDCPPVITIEDGKEADAFALNAGAKWLCAVSYELLKKLRLPPGLQAVVADESHYAKDPKAARSKALASVLKQHNVTWRLFLTGTPITVNPIDIFNQIECLYPGRFGHYYKFGDAYCGREENGYRYRGYDYVGVNHLRAEELYGRLAAFIFRRTKDEVADQLPELITQTILLPPDKSGEKKIAEALAGKGSLEEALSSAGSSKIDPIIRMVEEDFESGAAHVCLSSYYQVTGEQVAGRLQDAAAKWPKAPKVFYVDGRIANRKRDKIIEEAKTCPYAILVTTMKSVMVGINLTKFSPAYGVELYSAPGVVSQWAGRFHRVGGESATAVVRFVVREGSDEERIAQVLEKRIKEQGKVIAKSHMDKAVLSAIESKTESPQEFLSRLRETMNSGGEEDVYR